MTHIHVTPQRAGQSAGARHAICLGLALLSLLCLLQPGRTEPRELCAVCGRDWTRSPSRIRFTLVIDKHAEHILVCSPFCMCERLERYTQRAHEVKSPRIVDYSTLADEESRWVMLDKATFLEGIKGDTKQASEPLVAGFARKSVAQEQQATLGGKIMIWDELRQECVKLAQDYEPPKPSTPHTNPSRRPR